MKSNDKVLLYILAANVVLFLVAAPACLALLHTPAVESIWIALIGSSLVTWTGVVTIAAVREMAKSIAALPKRDPAETVAPQGALATE